MYTKYKIPQYLLLIVNQLFEIEQKAKKLKEPNSIQRNIDKLKVLFENNISDISIGLVYHNPLGESYNITRTDCEASIAGSSTENLVITEVIKPIIRIKKDNETSIVQRAVVIVESKKMENLNG